MFFPAKILLFGEYAIVRGGRGVAIPYYGFGGALAFASQQQLQQDAQIAQSHKAVVALVQQIEQQQEGRREDTPNWDIVAMQQALDRGLYFASTIPQGYGLGSSGALIAALYQQFALSKTNNNNWALLKQQFAHTESHLHGKSSGIDPLVCYLQQALAVQGNTITPIRQATSAHKSQHCLFLLDTQQPRQTAPLVQQFLQKLEDVTFLSIYQQQLLPLNEACINAWQAADMPLLFDLWGKLSNLQLHHFDFLIPQNLHTVWQKGIDTGNYYLKICGAGGGGFMLGMAANKQTAMAVGKVATRKILIIDKP